jgi:hypothetical protein
MLSDPKSFTMRARSLLLDAKLVGHSSKPIAAWLLKT